MATTTVVINNGSVDNITLSCDITTITSFHTAVAFYSLWVAAVAILIVYCFLQKRKYVCSGCCKGYPGLFIPLNLIQTSPFRILYVIIFGSLTGEILVAILSDDSQFASSGFSSTAGATFTGITLMLLLSVLYAPLFASVEAPVPVLGFAVGFFYGSALLTRDALSLVRECNAFNQMSIPIETWLLIGSYIPVIICKFIIVLWFLVSFIYTIVFLVQSKKPLRQTLFEHKKSTYHHDRVRWLLSRWKINVNGLKDEEKRSHSEKMEDCFYKWIYGWDSKIQFPLRYLAAVLIMFFSAYNLTLASAGYLLSALPGVLQTITTVEESARDMFELIPENASLAINVTSFVITVIDVIHDSVFALNVILPAGPLIAFVFNTVLLVNMMARVHIHLKLQAKGDMSFLPQTVPSPVYRLVQSIQYLGYQIAYFVWAWIVVVLVVWAAGLVCFVIYEFGRFHRDKTIEVISALILPLLYSFVVYYIQLVFCKLMFVGDTKNKHTVINNLRLFHWFTYFLLFQNIVVGITSALLRILYSLLFGVLLLFRLDRVILMRGFERYDKGHKTYIAFLLLEHTLNNSVLNVFVELLTTAVPLFRSADSADNKQRPLSEIIHDLQLETTMSHYPRISKQALNRWMVAYTLIRNPGLQKLTATQIRTQNELKLEQNRQWRALNRQRKDHPQTDKASDVFEPATEAILTVEAYDMLVSDVSTFQQSSVHEEKMDVSETKDLEIEQEEHGICLQEIKTESQAVQMTDTSEAAGLSTQDSLT